jgi:hypothetical protein
MRQTDDRVPEGVLRETSPGDLRRRKHTPQTDSPRLGSRPGPVDSSWPLARPKPPLLSRLSVYFGGIT